ncbi:MAG: tRNA (N(6)-L-threonylcarbamoyladenosine(37)-C(2))-methylthiotransferase MtaB [Huintestinicola sp.]
MNIYFFTFGCKVNTYETAAMSQMLENAGFSITGDYSTADIYVVNSCTVTAESESKLRKTLRKIKRERPDSITVLTGCYPQAFPQEAQNDGYADIIIGTKERSNVVSALRDYISSANHSPHYNVVPYTNNDLFEEYTVKAVDGHTRAFVKIQDGCNRFCSYCIIPYSRGRIRSKPVSLLKKEIQDLAENGYTEIVLVGINLAFYGTEFGMRLIDAVETVCSVDGIKRVRLGSLEPEMITEDDLKRLKALPQFCPSFHLSLQSGCDSTLARMNRNYTSNEYYELTQLIKRYFPACSFTTDIMTGFPAETEEDHHQSIDFIKRIGFADIHVFPYSRRKGTKADEMPGQVPMEIRKRRAAEMTAAANELRIQFLEKSIGSIYPVLFERERNSQFHNGYTTNYIHVKILQKNSGKSLRNMIFFVKIDKIDNGECIGHIVE